MRNNLQKIELEILKEFEKIFPKLIEVIQTSIKQAQKVEREFTGVGTFVSFFYENTDIFSNKILKSKRYNSVIIKSKEFIHDCPVDLVFEENGLIDYIEFSIGMREKNYPKEYEICYHKPNVIVDKYASKQIRFIEHFLAIPYLQNGWCSAVADMEYKDLEEIKEKINHPKRWEDITINDMKHYRDAIFFMHDKVKLYYFPTYIKYLLENPKELEGLGTDITFFMVLKDIELSYLTKKQTKSVYNFLIYLKNHNKTYNYDLELINSCLDRFNKVKQEKFYN